MVNKFNIELRSCSIIYSYFTTKMLRKMLCNKKPACLNAPARLPSFTARDPAYSLDALRVMASDYLVWRYLILVMGI